jgi:hypothetical protein
MLSAESAAGKQKLQGHRAQIPAYFKPWVFRIDRNGGRKNI